MFGAKKKRRKVRRKCLPVKCTFVRSRKTGKRRRVCRDAKGRIVSYRPRKKRAK